MTNPIHSIVILTGAGISAESGLSTFRDEDGLWCNYKIEDVCTPEAFSRNPDLVQEFYNLRREQLGEVQPNPAHEALAELAKRWPGEVLLVTQNVDDLHDRPVANVTPRGDFSLLHMHGELTKARCAQTGQIVDWREHIQKDTFCSCCKEPGTLRPHIVWFGEMPLYMERISQALRQCDLFISIGTSGNVYPAAGFVQEANFAGAHTVELNLEPSLGQSMFAEKIYGKASEIVPDYINNLLNNKN